MVVKQNVSSDIKVTEKEISRAITIHIVSLFGLVIFLATLTAVSIDVLLINKNFLVLFYLIIPVIINIGIPFIMWRSLRNFSSFVNEQCKQSLNFQISITLYFIISIAGVFVIIGAVLLFILILFDVSSVIDAVKRTRKGEEFRYSYSIHFIR